MSEERQHGRSTYLKYKCRCAICVEDAREYKRKRIQEQVMLDPELFIARLKQDGRWGFIDTSTVHKWRSRGFTVWAADRWAVKYGYHPVEIWGCDFYEGCGA